MAREYDPYKLASPLIYLYRMVIFLVIVSFVLLILYRQIITAFQSNPGLNGVIVCVGVFGILLAFAQVIRLFPEVRWVNSYRIGDPGLEVREPPRLLAPMASLLGDRLGDVGISTTTMRSILESIGSRLDEAREISRYLTGLLVFLGLLGTFWGLLTTVGSVSATIQSLDVGSGEANVIFEDLKAGLEAPLSGMGTAFSSSLFGLAGSLILGFLDLQAGQAQTRFYNDLEDWLSTVTEVRDEELGGASSSMHSAEDLRLAIEKLSRAVNEGGGVQRAAAGGEGDPGARAAQVHAMANLAEGIQGLIKHMRTEHSTLRDWVGNQEQQQREISNLLRRLAHALEQEDG